MNTIAFFVGAGIMLWAIVEMIANLVQQRGKTEPEINRLKGAFVSAALFGVIGFCMGITILSYSRVITEYEPLPTLMEMSSMAQETLTPSK
jgi:hypothetical protein